MKNIQLPGWLTFVLLLASIGLCTFFGSVVYNNTNVLISSELFRFTTEQWAAYIGSWLVGISTLILSIYLLFHIIFKVITETRKGGQ